MKHRGIVLFLTLAVLWLAWGSERKPDHEARRNNTGHAR
jgi:hypothetical protein